MDASLEEARKAMIAKRFGGKAPAAAGGARRNQKAAHKPVNSGKPSITCDTFMTLKCVNIDDKKLNSTLKKLGVQSIGGIEEVNLFKNDGNVIHFSKPIGNIDF
jgi:hypothetical protein